MSTEIPDRGRLASLIEDHLRRYGAEAARVLDVFAARHAMHPTDLQALVLIMNAERQGTPATAKDLRMTLGLTSGGVTAVVDRLEQAGHVTRARHPDDRRQHTLHYGARAMQLGLEFFGALGQRMEAVIDNYDTEELEVVERFLRAAAEAMVDHRQSLDR